MAENVVEPVGLRNGNCSGQPLATLDDVQEEEIARRMAVLCLQVMHLDDLLLKPTRRYCIRSDFCGRGSTSISAGCVPEMFTCWALIAVQDGFRVLMTLNISDDSHKMYAYSHTGQLLFFTSDYMYKPLIILWPGGKELGTIKANDDLVITSTRRTLKPISFPNPFLAQLFCTDTHRRLGIVNLLCDPVRINLDLRFDDVESKALVLIYALREADQASWFLDDRLPLAEPDPTDVDTDFVESFCEFSIRGACISEEGILYYDVIDPYGAVFFIFECRVGQLTVTDRGGKAYMFAIGNRYDFQVYSVIEDWLGSISKNEVEVRNSPMNIATYILNSSTIRIHKADTNEIIALITADAMDLEVKLTMHEGYERNVAWKCMLLCVVFIQANCKLGLAHQILPKVKKYLFTDSLPFVNPVVMAREHLGHSVIPHPTYADLLDESSAILLHAFH